MIFIAADLISFTDSSKVHSRTRRYNKDNLELSKIVYSCSSYTFFAFKKCEAHKRHARACARRRKDVQLRRANIRFPSLLPRTCLKNMAAAVLL